MALMERLSLQKADMSRGFFEIKDEHQFFSIIERTLESYQETRAKYPEQLLLLVLGLAHLREWIAPDYKKGSTPKCNAEIFSANLLENHDYQKILALANHTKHQRRPTLPHESKSEFIDPIDDRDIPIDSWMDFDSGPASKHYYDNKDVLEYFISITSLYEDYLFSSSHQEK